MGSQLMQIRHDRNAILCEEGVNLGGAGIGIDVKGLGRVRCRLLNPGIWMTLKDIEQDSLAKLK
jgi:hypothetical protein